MTNKEIKIAYQEFQSLDELEAKDKELAQAAVEATELAYAPYSKFNVGAAVLFEDGVIIKGSNQENAAYPSGLCAERVALFHAHHTFPKESVKAIAVIARGSDGNITPELTFPCAACIQVMVESEKRGNGPIAIIIGSATKVLMVDSVQNLLPFSFGK